MRLKDKVAVVTGGGSGFGAGVVQKFVAEGARVIVADLNLDAAQAVAQSLGAQAQALRADVTQAQDVKAMLEAAQKSFGGLDILVNNAGIQHTALIEDFPLEKWDAIIAINLSSAWHMMRAAVPHMKAAKWGRIINFAGMNAIHGYNGRAHVSASKHAAWGLTKALAKEFGPKGIRVNAVSGGVVHTDALEHFPNKDEMLAMGDRTPAGRIVEPQDMANAVAWLAGPESAMIVGQTLIIDGGYSLPA